MTNHRYIRGKRKDRKQRRRKARRAVADADVTQPGIGRRIDSHSPRGGLKPRLMSRDRMASLYQQIMYP